MQKVDKQKQKKINGWLKWLLIILAILLIVIAGALIYANSYIDRSKAMIEGEITIDGIENTIEVIRDDSGVPHISAESDEDLFFAQGFVTAQDRLFQMEMARRQASGRLSEVAGEAALNSDKYFRTLGLRRAAEKSAELYDEESMAALEAYAAGVNAFIKEAEKEDAYPGEFFLMGLDEMEEWTPVDSLTIGKYMAFDLGGHWERQAFNYYLVNQFEEEEAFELFPTYPSEALTNISDEEYVDITTSMTKAEQPHHFNGSNNWVVSGNKTDSGAPLLADDPHLGLATPSIWYQMHLQSPSYDVSGVIFAGIPGIILGHNEDIAWGVTNVGPDVQQLYVERRNEENSHEFMFDDEWVEADVIEETIDIDGEESISYEVLETVHGPIISEFANGIDSPEANTALSLRWTALDASPELSAVLQMNRASDWEEFETALEDFHTPAQNFVFASQDGTIAYKANGKIPIYENPEDALLPMPGWDSDYMLEEYIPFDELPKVVNPEKGFVGTANNKIISDVYPYHISHVWAQPYRYTRIHEVLEESDNLTIEDMKDLQMDKMNLRAREFTPIFLDILDSQDWDDKEKEALELLSNWDYVDEENQGAPLIFNRLFAKIEDELYKDEIPEDVLEMFKGSSQNADVLVNKAYAGESSIWIDKQGGLESLIQESFTETIEELTASYGEEVSGWTWGDFHQVYFEHPLSGISILDRFFNKKDPVPVGGSSVTVMAASHGDDGVVNHGASWRFVVDLSDLTNADHIVGPGQAGHYRSDWYDDQIEGWVSGTYHETKLDDYEGYRLILKPQ
ncbi:penicillin acylase family protein [Halalkalibacillus sediminis]|uniref:Penicillin acylase family protein n=1 Tax=Halalkalibacillus sediminis TaxID=2018042 RepID=A0A2I0QVS7_9BACI|nr:penicillin acylase family protein [Halalkalibacillus sediminis]PKR78443.1 penicillin acylase family protein [Halalkalibacillus sediminis]